MATSNSIFFVDLATDTLVGATNLDINIANWTNTSGGLVTADPYPNYYINSSFSSQDFLTDQYNNINNIQPYLNTKSGMPIKGSTSANTSAVQVLDASLLDNSGNLLGYYLNFDKTAYAIYQVGIRIGQYYVSPSPITTNPTNGLVTQKCKVALNMILFGVCIYSDAPNFTALSVCDIYTGFNSQGGSLNNVGQPTFTFNNYDETFQFKISPTQTIPLSPSQVTNVISAESLVATGTCKIPGPNYIAYKGMALNVLPITTSDNGELQISVKGGIENTIFDNTSKYLYGTDYKSNSLYFNNAGTSNDILTFRIAPVTVSQKEKF
jgi:hypothetical protein